MLNRIKRFLDWTNTWTGTVVVVLFVIFFFAQAFVIPSGSMKNTLLVGDHLFVKKFSYGIPTPSIPFLEVKILPDFFGNGHLIEGQRPKRGDIVVFRNVLNEKEYYVKRLFAVGNDEVIYSHEAAYLRPHEGDKFIKSNYKKEDIITLNGKLFVKEPYKYPGIHYDDNVNMFEQMIAYLNLNKLAMKPIIVQDLPNIGSLPFNAFYFKVKDDEFFMLGDNRDHSNDSRFWGSVPYKNVIGKPWFIYFSWDDEYKVRWDRIGRLIETVQDRDDIVSQAVKEQEKHGIY